MNSLQPESGSRSTRGSGLTCLLLSGLLLAGAGGACDSPPPGALGPPQGPCGAVVQVAPSDSANHAPQGTPLTWLTNPPAEGPHYPVWAPWATAFPEVVPRGNWLHNAEHGGVILLYNCPSGCPDVIAQLQSVGTALPQDSACEPPINARWLLTADPLLPDGVQVSAVGWGYLYTASCFDAVTLQPFLSDHYAHGPEDFCSEGAIAWR